MKFADIEPRLTMALVRRLEADALAIEELEQLGAKITPELIAFRDGNRALLSQLDTAVLALRERDEPGA